MSRLIGSRNRPDHQKVEDLFADLSAADQAKCLAACGALHRWKLNTGGAERAAAVPSKNSAQIPLEAAQ